MKFDEEKKSAHIPIKRTGRPEEVAKVVCFLASDDVVQGYALGAKSSYGSVSLFCGSLALIGCMLSFLSKRESLRAKSAFGALLGGGSAVVLLEALVHCVLPF